jgi:hypothetical protein
MTPGPADDADEAIAALRLVLVALDDDTEAAARNDAINVITRGIGSSEERWREIALSAARLAALFATTVHGPPGSDEARFKARTALQKLLVGALDRRDGPHT